MRTRGSAPAVVPHGNTTGWQGVAPVVAPSGAPSQKATLLSHTTASIEAQADAAADLLAGRVVAVLTGAGVSTDSGIPDYRGAGTPPRRAPMTWQRFTSDEGARKRYWAGGHLGWSRFSTVMPNAAHFALAELEDAAVTNGVITQNVDGLHTKAGSRRVVDLHGSGHIVRCLSCGQRFARDAIEERIGADNPWLDAGPDLVLNPDGDADITAVDQLIVPTCTVCGGMLKPDVVFFGELVPVLKFEEARSMVDAAGALVVAGSSLAVNSGIRLLETARRARKPIVIINRGATKGDGRSVMKIDAGVGEILLALRDRLA